jgi:hypothetical protein
MGLGGTEIKNYGSKVIKRTPQKNEQDEKNASYR